MELWEVRKNFREGLYDKVREYDEQFMFTGTWEAKKLLFEPTPEWLVAQVKRYFDASSARGVVTAEVSRNGRLHVHGLLVASDDRSRRSMDEFVRYWTTTLGYGHLTKVTDLMGAIMYITKTFGEETLYEWRL